MHSKNYAIVGIVGKGRKAKYGAIVIPDGETEGEQKLKVKETKEVKLIEAYPVSKADAEVLLPFYRTFFAGFFWVIDKIK